MNRRNRLKYKVKHKNNGSALQSVTNALLLGDMIRDILRHELMLFCQNYCDEIEI